MSTPSPSGAPGWVSSVVALALGLVLSVAVSGLFSVLGWGGDLASQTAGATSGAAPLLVDAFRHRRALRGGAAQVPSGPRARRDWPRKLLVVSCFAFAVLLVESAWGWFIYHLTGWTIRLARGDVARFQPVYTLLAGVFSLPVVLGAIYLLALAAGRRLRDHRRRWTLLGVGIYTVVRVLNAVVALGGPRTDRLPAVTPSTIVWGFVVVVPLVYGITLLGVRRARRTQAAFDASSFFRRLEPGDREAALALLDDARPARPAPGPWVGPPSSTPSPTAASEGLR